MITYVDGFDYPEGRKSPTDQCDAGCGQPSQWWFGLSNWSYCGAQACLEVLKERQNAEGEKPGLGRCVGTLAEGDYVLLAKIAGLEAGVAALQRQKADLLVEVDVLRRANGWQAVKLVEQAKRLNHLSPIPEADDLDQRIEDWHEGRAGVDQPLHEYLGLSWAEYADWISPRPAPTLAVVLEKVDDICERFELDGLHSHPTYKQFKRLWAELDALKGTLQ